MNFDSLKSEAAFKPWLISIVRNAVADYYRNKDADKAVPYSDEIGYTVSINRTFGLSVEDTMERLSDEERRLLQLYYWQEKSVNEIADILHIPAGTVKSRLHKARKNFESKYPREEIHMNKLPETMFDYSIKKIDSEPFEPEWKELMGWFLVPEEGNKLKWGLYDFPEKTLTETFEMKCTGKAMVHGLQGVKVEAIEREGRSKMVRHFIAQLTDTHCRYLAESHVEDGVEKYYTFLDGDDFINNWGFGPDNIGNEIHLKQKGIIKRNGNIIECDANAEVMDVVGRYEVTINDKTYDTVCLMDIGLYDENTVSEQYIDHNGRTILWRRFNKENWRWNFDRFEQTLDEKLKDNEFIIVNSQKCLHWYDCITDYIL